MPCHILQNEIWSCFDFLRFRQAASFLIIGTPLRAQPWLTVDYANEEFVICQILSRSYRGIIDHIKTMSTNNAACFYPQGAASIEGDVPCPSTDSSGAFACCPPTWKCESNGLCSQQGKDYYQRATCSDQTWQSPECPDICSQSV